MPHPITASFTPEVELVRRLVTQIEPFDSVEAEHRSAALNWIESGAPIFRIQKPDTPNQHLVSYFVVMDKSARKILLVDHKKAGLWLPTGGHVEVNEDPCQTVVRECREELGIEAMFWQKNPIFITVTTTVGLTAGHIDVSLWYVLEGRCNADYVYDQTEFNCIGWFDFDQLPLDRTDPHMARFTNKLNSCLRRDSPY